MADYEGPPSRKSTGRRLSFADEAPPDSARLLVEEIPVESEAIPLPTDGLAEQLLSTGAVQELYVHLGILRQGNTYGITQPLPDGTVAAQVLAPVPEGVSVAIGATELGQLCAVVELELFKDGRQVADIRIQTDGAEKPELLLRLEMKAMGPRDGRPSAIHTDVRLLRCASQESISASSEASEWRRGQAAGHAAGVEEDQLSP